jgi:hypothetical protein
VLAYGDTPDIYLTGIIYHANYFMLPQWTVDEIARLINVKRPVYHQLHENSLTQLSEIVKNWVGKEGICVYYPVTQWPFWEIKKLKSADYLTKHAFKSNLTLANTLDLFLEYGEPSYSNMRDKVQAQFNLDWETMQMVIPFISKLTDAKDEITKILDHMRQFINYNNLRKMSRKDAADKIISAYGRGNRSNILFTLLDGNEVSTKQKLGLYHQILGE